MLSWFFVCWHLNQESWLEVQKLGFRNRAIKYSLKTRQLINGYIGSIKMHKTIGTPPCTLRQPWVSVGLGKGGATDSGNWFTGFQLSGDIIKCARVPDRMYYSVEWQRTFSYINTLLQCHIFHKLQCIAEKTWQQIFTVFYCKLCLVTARLKLKLRQKYKYFFCILNQNGLINA